MLTNWFLHYIDVTVILVVGVIVATVMSKKLRAKVNVNDKTTEASIGYVMQANVTSE